MHPRLGPGGAIRETAATRWRRSALPALVAAGLLVVSAPAAAVIISVAPAEVGVAPGGSARIDVVVDGQEGSCIEIEPPGPDITVVARPECDPQPGRKTFVVTVTATAGAEGGQLRILELDADLIEVRDIAVVEVTVTAPASATTTTTTAVTTTTAAVPTTAAATTTTPTTTTPTTAAPATTTLATTTLATTTTAPETTATGGDPTTTMPGTATALAPGAAAGDGGGGIPAWVWPLLAIGGAAGLLLALVWARGRHRVARFGRSLRPERLRPLFDALQDGGAHEAARSLGVVLGSGRGLVSLAIAALAGPEDDLVLTVYRGRLELGRAVDVVIGAEPVRLPGVGAALPVAVVAAGGDEAAVGVAAPVVAEVLEGIASDLREHGHHQAGAVIERWVVERLVRSRRDHDGGEADDGG